MGLKVHIVSHTHWDREWFLSSDYTSKWLIPFFERLFSILDSNRDYRFVFDGQMQMIYDYLQELPQEERDAKKRLLQKYGAEGRLFFGPYWGQIDWKLSGAESIVRNLLIGGKYAEEFGNRMKAGWLLDVFGQIGQTPQIHLLAGIDVVFVWRGVEFPDDRLRSEFFWESPDGSKVVASYFFDSYRNLMGLTAYPEIALHRVKNEVEKMSPYLVSPNVLLMNGYDLDTYPEDPFTVIPRDSCSDFLITQSDPESYMEDVKSSGPSLNVLRGEMLSGRYLCVFPGTLSTRVYLKLWNYSCEYLLRNLVEPIGVLSWYLTGFYPHSKVEELWKGLIANQIHDNIAGVCVDRVHALMEKRYIKIFDEARSILYNMLSRLCGRFSSGSVVVFNTNPFEVTLPVDIGDNLLVIDRVPPLGFKLVKDADFQQIFYLNKRFDSFSWENEFYTASFNPDGTINIYDKASGQYFSRVGYFYDEADGGDEYNYSPVEGSESFSTLGRNASFKLVYRTDFSAKIFVETTLSLPEKLRSEKRVTLKIRYEITFDTTPLIKYHLFVDNVAMDHRLKIVFPTSIEDGEIVAEMPFEYVVRPGYIDNSRPIPSEYERLFIGARECEKEYAFPMRDFVSVRGKKSQFTVMTKGLYEYEVRGSTLYVTLLRAVGWMARTDIKSRVGDAGPEMYTPGAQCCRKIEYRFAIFAVSRELQDDMLTRWVQIYHNPPLVVRVERSESEDNVNSFSLPVGVDSTPFWSKVKLTAAKVAEGRRGIILRMFNPRSENLSLDVPDGITCFKTDLLENNIEGPLKCIEIAPSEILTLKFKSSPAVFHTPDSTIEVLEPAIALPVTEKLVSETPDPEVIREIESRICFLSRQLKEIEKELQKKEGLAYHELRFRYFCLKRTYLELKLSYLLNTQEMDGNECSSEIERIGRELNDARIKRRAYEYVLDYWKNKYKKPGEGM